MNNLGTVIGFTLRNKLRTKAFIVTSVIMIVIMSIVANIPYFISLMSGNEMTKVGMISDTTGIPKQLESYFAAQKEASVRIVLNDDAGSVAANEEKFRKQMTDKQIDGYLLLTEDKQTGFPKAIYKSESTNFSIQNDLQVALFTLKTGMVTKELGLTAEQVARINSPIELDSVQISLEQGAGSVGTGKTPEQIALARGMVYVLIIVLFMGIMITGQLIATEITTEKSSRIMEVLITSVSPLTQMFGKIIGMFLVGIIQLSVFGIVALINLNLPHNAGALGNLGIDLSQLDTMLIVYAVVFYLLGYFLYATMFAAVGSLVSRTEDLGQAVMPITMLTMIGFYIGIFGLANPGSTIVIVTSYIPFFTPFIMFLRIGLTDPAIWEVALGFGILIVSILAAGWLSAKIYRTGVLMYGKRPSIKELIKAMKAYKI